MEPFAQGFATGASLIVAIGAQNLFVLTRGLAGRHVAAVCLVCAAVDALLIAAGVSGVGTAVAASPRLGAVAAWGGAAFLGFYGWGALRAAWRGDALTAMAAEADKPLRAVLAATLAVSLLNPHVYLDTVVLLGAMGGRHPGAGRFVFGAGAALASLCWFCALGLGARCLAPAFARPAAWRVLHLAVACTMWLLAASLVRGVVA